MEPTIYLFFKGDCLEAMTRYAEILGGEITGVFRNGDAPDLESRTPGGDDMVMNLSMKLGSATVMASDAPESMYSKPQGFRVSIAPPSREASTASTPRWPKARSRSRWRRARPSGPSASRCSPTGTARPGC
jgi:uncharacterized glyoxalase superfamily protein PhnB